MAIDLPFRRRAVRTLSNEICCYLLCDLDQVPIYVGQSVSMASVSARTTV